MYTHIAKNRLGVRWAGVDYGTNGVHQDFTFGTSAGIRDSIRDSLLGRGAVVGVHGVEEALQGNQTCSRRLGIMEEQARPVRVARHAVVYDIPGPGSHVARQKRRLHASLNVAKPLLGDAERLLLPSSLCEIDAMRGGASNLTVLVKERPVGEVKKAFLRQSVRSHRKDTRNLLADKRLRCLIHVIQQI